MTSQKSPLIFTSMPAQIDSKCCRWLCVKAAQLGDEWQGCGEPSQLAGSSLHSQARTEGGDGEGALTVGGGTPVQRQHKGTDRFYVGGELPSRKQSHSDRCVYWTFPPPGVQPAQH
jgi:hypothetical protein